MAIYFRTPNGNVRQASTIHMNVGNNVGEKRIQSIYYGASGGNTKQIYEGSKVALINNLYRGFYTIFFNNTSIPSNATTVISDPKSKYKVVTYAGSNIYNNFYSYKVYTTADKVKFVGNSAYKLFSSSRVAPNPVPIDRIIFDKNCANLANCFDTTALTGNCDKLIIPNNNVVLSSFITASGGNNLYGTLKTVVGNNQSVYGLSQFFYLLYNGFSNVNLSLYVAPNANIVNWRLFRVNCNTIKINYQKKHYNIRAPYWLVSWSRYNYFFFETAAQTGEFNNLLQYEYNTRNQILQGAYINLKSLLVFTNCENLVAPSLDAVNGYHGIKNNFFNNFYIYCNSDSIANMIMQQRNAILVNIYYNGSSYSSPKYDTFYVVNENNKVYRPDDLNHVQAYYGDGFYGAYRGNNSGIYILYDYLQGDGI